MLQILLVSLRWTNYCQGRRDRVVCGLNMNALPLNIQKSGSKVFIEAQLRDTPLG